MSKAHYTADQIRRAVREFRSTYERGQPIDMVTIKHRGMIEEAIGWYKGQPATNKETSARAEDAIERFPRSGTINRKDFDCYISVVLETYADCTRD